MAALRELDFNRIVNSRSTWVDARVLGIATAEVHTVPTGANFVRMSGNLDFYANFGAAAAVPAADVTDGTSSILNPSGIYPVGDVTTIGLISPAATIVTLEFFK